MVRGCNDVDFNQNFAASCYNYYQAIACWIKNREPAPGKLFDIDGSCLHLYVIGKGSPTIVLDHSLGGIEGYLLTEELPKLA